MRVLLFCPTYRLEPETVKAIFAQQYDGAIDFLFTRDNPYSGDDDGKANILHNYRKGRQAFLDGGYDAMFVVESDIIPPRDALPRLLALNADVAYGLYLFRRHEPYHCNVTRYAISPAPDQPLSMFPKAYAKAWREGVVKCSGSGLGCVVIKRRVLEQVEFHQRNQRVHCDTFFTEDVWQHKFNLQADMRVICGHKTPDGRILWPTEECGAWTYT